MKHLVWCSLAALALPSILWASLEPPPVTIDARVSGEIVPGRPFLVHATVAPAGRVSVTGRLTVRPSPGLTVAGSSAFDGRDLVVGGRVEVTFAVTPSVNAVRELDLGFTPAGSDGDRAVLRLFVKPGPRGRVMTIDELVQAESTRTVTGAGRRPARLFALRTGPATPLPRADGPVVKGQLFYTAYRGETVPARRMRAELWAESGRGRTLADATDVGPDGSFVLRVPAGGAGRLVPVFTLETARWTIQDRNEKVYGWEAPALANSAGGVDLGSLQIPNGQAAQEACWIHTVLNQALDRFLELSLDIGWWPSVPVEWPASGDYFNYTGVCLTKAFQWDVVGHEFGHALFHYGSQAQGSGGEHYIDRCYGQSLAWSEGWASFFSAAVNLPRDDSDARFEFMVPRRAPIRIENVPDDVCKGPGNEWRVAAALWDLHDTHADGDDQIALDFATMWSALREGGRLTSLPAYAKFLRARISADQTAAFDRALKFNTMQ